MKTWKQCFCSGPYVTGLLFLSHTNDRLCISAQKTVKNGNKFGSTALWLAIWWSFHRSTNHQPFAGRSAARILLVPSFAHYKLNAQKSVFSVIFYMLKIIMSSHCYCSYSGITVPTFHSSNDRLSQRLQIFSTLKNFALWYPITESILIANIVFFRWSEVLLLDPPGVSSQLQRLVQKMPAVVEVRKPIDVWKPIKLIIRKGASLHMCGASVRYIVTVTRKY